MNGTGPDMAYGVDPLLAGAVGHEAVAAAADLMASTLARVVVEAAAFGGVPVAGALATVLELARDQQGRAAAAEAAQRAQTAIGVSRAARLGACLLDDTAAIATSAAPGSITAGMGPG